jgi:hypothetical protein
MNSTGAPGLARPVVRLDARGLCFLPPLRIAEPAAYLHGTRDGQRRRL